MSKEVYATEFRSKLTPTHQVMNNRINKPVIKGTKAECLAFLSGLEHADNSRESLWYDCILSELEL